MRDGGIKRVHMTDKKPTTVGFYTISHPVKHEHSKKTWWMRIGSATLLDNGTIMARIEAVPVNWNGSFHLFPKKTEEDED